jgi:membrane-bound metal-dependent hydrolase YbcI (DUF457 family)
MPYAFTHIVFSWLFGKGYEKTFNKKILRLGWFLLFFGAVLPDIDYLLEWALNIPVHRTFTHSFLFLIFVFVLAIVVFRFLYAAKTVERERVWFYVGCITLGVFLHILLDFVTSYTAGIPLFWPYETYYGLFSGIQSRAIVMAINYNTVDVLYSKLKWAIFDMGLGVAWLFYLIYSHKIKEF